MKRQRGAPQDKRPFKKKKSRFEGRIRVSPEKKNLDVLNSNSIALGPGGTLFLLNGCDDGTTVNTRIGRRILLTSLTVRWQGYMTPTSAGASGLRLLIVYDRQPNAATPAITDIMQFDDISSMMQLSNSKRFKVIVDELVPCVGSNGEQAWNRSIYRKLNLPVEFNENSTNTITSITTGALFAIVWQAGGITTLAPVSDVYTRVRFLDI